MPDRYADVAPLIRTYAAEMDDALNRSAQKTGGTRHIRFRHDQNCQLVVTKVQLSATGDDLFANTKAELRSLGYTNSARKYVTWVDANTTDTAKNYCGIGEVKNDDTPTQSNENNGASSVQGLMSRIDPGCWTGQSISVALHELVHNLGGVQLFAPNTSDGWHCTDEWDLMCYSDDLDDPTLPAMNYVCASSEKGLLDCNNDDYFHTSPASGTYLATNWNVARSSFLSTSSDTVQPVVTVAPLQELVGPVSTSDVKTSIRWAASDASGIASNELWQTTDNGATWIHLALPTNTTNRVVRPLVPGKTYKFAVKAKDSAGNWQRLVLRTELYRSAARDQSNATVRHSPAVGEFGTPKLHGGTTRNHEHER